MARTSPTTQPAARTPRGIQYHALKGMSYRPTKRDQRRSDRRAAKSALKDHS